MKQLIYEYIKANDKAESYFFLEWLTRIMYEKDLEASYEADKEVKRIKKQIKKKVSIYGYMLFILNKSAFYDKYYFNIKD